MKRPRSPHPPSLLFACVLILTLLLYPTVPSATQRSNEEIYSFTGLFAPRATTWPPWPRSHRPVGSSM